VQKEKAANAEPATVALEKDFHWLNASKPAGFGWMTQDLHPSGAVGDASKATAAKGEAALAHGAKAFVELLREIERFDLAALRKGPAQ
jgi:creatinine amidohydrolase